MRVGVAVLLPVLLAANYLVMVARHEGCHALAAVWTGAAVLAVHLWPPRMGNLSWIIVAADRPRAAWEVQLQAAAPYLVSLALLLASLIVLSGRSQMSPFLRLNVWLAGVAFPLVDVTVAVATYRLPGHDLWFLFGPPDRALHALLASWIVVLCGLAIATAWRQRVRAG